MNNTEKQIRDLKTRIDSLNIHIRNNPKDKSPKVAIVRTVYRYNALIKYNNRIKNALR